MKVKTPKATASTPNNSYSQQKHLHHDNKNLSINPKHPSRKQQQQQKRCDVTESHVVNPKNTKQSKEEEEM